MAPKTIKPPQVPQTPSRAINDMLNKNCNKQFESPPKAALAYAMCYFFQAVTFLYQKINKEHATSHKMWMASCGAVSLGVVIVSYLFFRVIIGCSFIFYSLLYYGTFMLGLFGIGLGVAGMVFFDKQAGSGRVEGFEGTGAKIGKKFDEVSEAAREKADEWKNQ